MTVFQAKLLKDKDAQWEIVRNMHKEFWGDKDPEKVMKKLNVYSHYNWVVIAGRIKSYGRIDLAVTNDKCTASGPGYTLESFEEIRAQNRFTFKLWRMSLDKLSDVDREFDHITKYIIIDDLKRRGYEPILAHEFLESYYKD